MISRAGNLWYSRNYWDRKCTSVKASLKGTAQERMLLWIKARIPRKRLEHIEETIKKIIIEYNLLHKKMNDVSKRTMIGNVKISPLTEISSSEDSEDSWLIVKLGRPSSDKSDRISAFMQYEASSFNVFMFDFKTLILKVLQFLPGCLFSKRYIFSLAVPRLCSGQRHS